MKDRNGKSVSAANVLWTFVMAAMLLAVMTNAANAKSLYVIADIKGSTSDATQPLHAYDIGVDGTLAFQAQHDIPHRMLGAVGLAIDSDSGYLFVTYEASETIQLVDGITMTSVGEVDAIDAVDLAGIVYDHAKKLLYCVDRGREKLYVYDWDAKAISLTPTENSPITLFGEVHAYGIALDEIDGILYVANGSKMVYGYRTSDWRRVKRIELSRVAISIAVDVMNGFLYTGAGYAGNKYLTQYHQATGTETEVQVEPDGGVMGLGVDPDTGLIYMSTGRNNAPGGDNLLVYDMELNLVDKTFIGGNPTGLAIPGKDIGFNPLNFAKRLLRGAADDAAPGEMESVYVGKNITYGIEFSNSSNEFTVTDVEIVDALPQSVTFVSAEDDGISGRYDGKTHSYRWFYPELPPGSSTLLELTVRVDSDVEAETVISNLATINSNETSPATTRFDVVAANNSLNLEKTILGVDAGRVAKVEPSDLITYIICFDNHDNDFEVTQIRLVDALPPQVDFVSADNGTSLGHYDDKLHAYIWSPQDMSPGDSTCVSLVARVHADLKPDTLITNAAAIDSNETPHSTASADAVIFKLIDPPSIVKSIAGNLEGQLAIVESNEEITYLIHLDNVNNSDVLTDVSVVDILPPEVDRVVESSPKCQEQTDKNGIITCTWALSDLQPNSKFPTELRLVVRLKKDLNAATVISNSATVYTREAAPATATAEAVTPSEGLAVIKWAIEDVSDDGAMQIDWVDIGDTFTYLVRVENNNDFALTNILIDDTLPQQVTLVDIRADDSALAGVYDAKTRRYEGSLPSLAAGTTVSVRLRVRVKEEVGLGKNKTIVNSVTVQSDATRPVTASASVTAGYPVLVGPPPEGMGGYVTVTPNRLRNNNSTNDLLVTIQLPPGFEKEDIDITKRLRAVFVYEQEGTDYVAPPVLIAVPAKSQQLLEDSSPATILATFDRAQVMEALPRLASWSMIVKGRYNDKGTFRTYRGSTNVFVTRFAGD